MTCNDYAIVFAKMTSSLFFQSNWESYKERTLRSETLHILWRDQWLAKRASAVCIQVPQLLGLILKKCESFKMRRFYNQYECKNRIYSLWMNFSYLSPHFKMTYLSVHIWSATPVVLKVMFTQLKQYWLMQDGTQTRPLLSSQMFCTHPTDLHTPISCFIEHNHSTVVWQSWPWALSAVS